MRKAAAPATDPAEALIAVDVVVFTIDEGALKTLAVRLREGPYEGSWAFPGGRVRADESLEAAAMRELAAQTGLADIYLEQLRTFGDPERDPRARVVSTAYVALLRDKERVQPGGKYVDVAWFPVYRLPALAYDHRRMASVALNRLRAKLKYTNIVYGLLAPEFTLGELQEVYEIILARSLDRRNFRKKILGTGLLRALPKERRGAHRPAQLFSFRRRRPVMIDIL